MDFWVDEEDTLDGVEWEVDYAASGGIDCCCHTGGVWSSAKDIKVKQRN